MKGCTCCGLNKPLGEFHKSRTAKDGLVNICKLCACLKTRLWAQANPERVEKNSRSYYQHRKADFKRRAKLWAVANKERRLEIRRASAERHLAEKRIKSRAYQRQFRHENPLLARLKGRINASRRHQRMKATSVKITVEQVQAILEQGNGLCVYCGHSCKSPTLDHYTALRNGGNNHPSNFVPCCKSCNSSKGIADGADWLEKHFGVLGLARALVFLESPEDISKAKLVKALFGIEIQEVE